MHKIGPWLGTKKTLAPMKNKQRKLRRIYDHYLLQNFAGTSSAAADSELFLISYIWWN